jgi:hypothetical protein
MAFNIHKTYIPKPLVGDWVVFLLSLILLFFLFKTLWHHEPAVKLQIRQGEKIYGNFSLNQSRELSVHGPLGITKILIKNGQVRFVSSPCRNQYCVHQGWLTHDGQVAICIPNQVSLELLGKAQKYDSINY